jgi:hypothetical protein
LHASWIHTFADRYVIDAEQRQALDAFLRQGLANGRVVTEGSRLLGQAVAHDVNTQTREPLEVCGELGQCWIDTGTAYAGRAAHGGIEDL